MASDSLERANHVDDVTTDEPSVHGGAGASGGDEAVDARAYTQARISLDTAKRLQGLSRAFQTAFD